MKLSKFKCVAIISYQYIKYEDIDRLLKEKSLKAILLMSPKTSKVN